MPPGAYAADFAVLFKGPLVARPIHPQTAFRQDFDGKIGGEALFRVQFEKVFTRDDSMFTSDQLIQASQTSRQHVRALGFLVRKHVYQCGQVLLFLFGEQGRVTLRERHYELAQKWTIDAEYAPLA